MLSSPRAVAKDRTSSVKKSANLLHSLRYALAGLWYSTTHEPHFQIILGIGGLVLVLGYVAGINPSDYAIILLAIAMLLCAEMLNTALEAVVDLASPQLHPLAKTAKDVAAAAVLVVIAADVGVALIILLPHVFK